MQVGIFIKLYISARVGFVRAQSVLPFGKSFLQSFEMFNLNFSCLSRALGQNPTESEVKKLVHEHRADERVTFEVFLPILQVCQHSDPDHMYQNSHFASKCNCVL
jgi:hypothetical protein